MKRTLPLAAVGALLLLVGGCKDQSEEVARLNADLVNQRNQLDESERRRIDDTKRLQDEIAALRARIDGGEGKAPMEKRLAELEAQVAAEDGAALEKRVAELDEQVKAARKEASEARTEAQKAAAGGGAVDEDRLAELAAKKVAEEQANSTPTKDLSQALNRLNVSDAEKQLIRQEILDAKKGILETLEVPTAEGRNMADELVDMIIKVQHGKAQEGEFIKLIADLQTAKLPGDARGRTYWQAIEDIKKANRENIGRILSPEDQKKLDAAHKDWSDFEVGDGDPWGPLYMERLQKYQAENK
ncbi:MAG: hypothetical protein KF696_04105 [Planctomycetes bacterium]|nr:hypothetical protein [Planctomycetota bacterium]MCW8134155.1 hypothetical protein [Planctomycetota bacterium]